MREIKFILLIVIILFIMSTIAVVFGSCTTIKPLHRSGNYEVTRMEKMDGCIKVHFSRVKGSYYVFSDTFKLHDSIYINVVIDTTGMSQKIKKLKNTKS